MAMAQEPGTARAWLRPVRFLVLVSVSAVIGLFGSAFGALFWLAGVVVLVVGLIGRPRWGWLSPVVAVGVGLVLGAAWYITLGLVQDDGATSCRGDATHMVCTAQADR